MNRIELSQIDEDSSRSAIEWIEKSDFPGLSYCNETTI